MTTTSRAALGAIAVLYAVILALPLMFQSNNELFIFLEQPLLILLPTAVFSGLYIRRVQARPRNFFRLNKISWKNMAMLTLLVFLLPGIVNYAADLTVLAFPSGDLSFEMAISPTDRDGLLWAAVALLYGFAFTSLFPGICEEVLFRGAILRMSEATRWKTPVLVVLNAALFAVFHQNEVQLFYTFIMGIVLTCVVLATNSLLASIYVHTFYNFIIDLSSSFDLDKNPALAFADSFISAATGPAWAAISITGITVIIWYMFKSAKTETPAEVDASS